MIPTPTHIATGLPTVTAAAASDAKATPRLWSISRGRCVADVVCRARGWAYQSALDGSEETPVIDKPFGAYFDDLEKDYPGLAMTLVAWPQRVYPCFLL